MSLEAVRHSIHRKYHALGEIDPGAEGVAEVSGQYVTRTSDTDT